MAGDLVFADARSYSDVCFVSLTFPRCVIVPAGVFALCLSRTTKIRICCNYLIVSVLVVFLLVCEDEGICMR